MTVQGSSHPILPVVEINLAAAQQTTGRNMALATDDFRASSSAEQSTQSVQLWTYDSDVRNGR
ncbi:hypothetical protein IFM47457_00285 [Aspergillus lentulus]|nr:hypothetical protein IFM47457_00285 [Aspergillus lentulus]